MIGTIRRHQKWLWIFIIGVTIVTFVPFVANTPRNRGGGDDRQTMDLGTLNGAPIAPEQFLQAQKDETLFYFFHYGKWPRDEKGREEVKYRAYQRVFFNAKIKEFKIEPTPAACARMVKEMFGLAPDQPVPMDKFQNLIIKELGSQGFTEADFSAFVRDQVAQQHLITLFGMSGKLITPKEAEYLYRRENEPMVAELVRFQAPSYEAQVNPTSQDLQKFFQDRQSAYRLPERVQVNYIKFEGSGYLAEADKELSTNLTQIVNQIYTERSASFKDKDGKPMSESDAKAEIKKRVREESAAHIATVKAREFQTELYKGHDDSNPFKVDDMEKLAKAKGLTVKTTELFDGSTGPKDLNVPQRFIQIAFALRDNDPEDKNRSMIYSSPIQAEDGAYLLGFKQHVASQPQAFEAVRDQVTRDYRLNQAEALARKAGEGFEGAVTNGMAAGKSFDAICAEQKVKAQTLSPFSLSSTNLAEVSNKAELQQLQSVAFNTPTGKASIFVPTETGGFLIFLKERKPVDVAKMNAELPNFLNRLREQRQMAAFNEWFQRQQSLELRMPKPQGEKAS